MVGIDGLINRHPAAASAPLEACEARGGGNPWHGDSEAVSAPLHAQAEAVENVPTLLGVQL